MSKKRRKPSPAKIKTKVVKLSPDTALKIAVPKGVAPTVIPDPAAGVLHVIPVPADELAKPGRFRRWLQSW